MGILWNWCLGGVSEIHSGVGAKPWKLLCLLASETFKMPNVLVNLKTKIYNISLNYKE